MEEFRLSMQMLYDGLSETYKDMSFYSCGDLPRLADFRLYQREAPLRSQFVYILEEENLPALPPDLSDVSFLLAGKGDFSLFPMGCPVLTVKDCTDFSLLISAVQDIFERYRQWERELLLAKNGERPLDRMLEASLKIFRNPVFVHDAGFYILSCPHRHPRMPVWEKDPKTGRDLLPLNIINDFKVDVEYLETLSATRAALFSAEQRSYPILFVNLWNNGRYEGRICVDELEHPILPGHYQALEYLGHFMEASIRSGGLFWLSMEDRAEQFFQEFIHGKIQDQSSIMRTLYFLKWNRHDRYLCLRLETERTNIPQFSAPATLSHIETLISGCSAFLHQSGITVIVNLSYSHSRASDILSSLAVLLRESLLKMGVSSEISDFFQLPQAEFQARTALVLGLNSQSTHWYYRFDDYLLEFLLQKGGEFLSPELLCSHKLLALRQYDENNHTEFYVTLKTFLELERNALQTAKALFIHRSTLFYRLERIEKIADVHLDDPKERLILRISFYILEQGT